MPDSIQVAQCSELGSLGVYHLKRLWSRVMAALAGVSIETGDEEKHWDRLVIDALGLGLQQTFRFLYVGAPSFAEFEDWIVSTAGRPGHNRVSRVNADITGSTHPDFTRQWLAEVEARTPVLSRDELAFWDENGYVILRNAVDGESRREAEQAIWSHVGADPDFSESWYENTEPEIMVELIQHCAFERTRHSARIHKAFAQLWGTPDLWASTDRCGFHVPQREDRPFPGPDLHWDLDFSKPPTFATQGILYLTDTAPEQGALTVVPGFHRRLTEWLQSLPPEADPQKEDLHALGSVPIGANAGDLIIWNHALPHGSRPNHGTRPRIVQYINMYPARNSGTGGCYESAPTWDK